jgi:hypothetical protein
VQVRECVCVAPEGACGVSAQGVLGERPQRPGRDANATSRSCRGVDAHGETVARLGVLRMSAAVALRCGCARTRAEPGCPGPRRGRAVRGAPASRARGTTRRRDGSGGRQRRVGLLHEKRHGGRKGRVPRVATGGSSATPAAEGKGRGTVAAALTEGSLAWVRDAVASWCRRVDAVQDARRRRRRRTGAGAVKLRWWRRPSPPRATPGGVSLLGLSSSSSFSLSLPRVRRRRSGTGARVVRV